MRISDWSSDVCSSDLDRKAGIDSLFDQIENPAPTFRGLLVLKQRERQRYRRAFDHTAQHRELVVHIVEIRDELKENATGILQRHGDAQQLVFSRSYKRRVGKACVTTCRSWWTT